MSVFSLVKLPPSLPGSFFLGNLAELKRDTLDFFGRTVSLGNLSHFRVLYKILYMTNHPDAAKYVLQENNRNYVKGDAYRELRHVLGKGLLTSEGDFWLKHRRIIQPGFHRDRIESFVGVMAKHVNDMLGVWEEKQKKGEEVDVSAEMMKLTLGIVGDTLLSRDVRGEADEVSKSMDFILEYAINRIKNPGRLPVFFPTPENLEFNRNRSILNGIVEGIISDRRKGGDNYRDLLDMLMKARDEVTGEVLNDKQIRDEVMTLFLAGHETTANALTWLWYLLSENQEAEEKIRAEVSQVIGSGVITAKKLFELDYTSRVINETLRLFPPAWIISRKNIKKDEILGYTIPSGSNVGICTYFLHRHPGFWKDPEKFDPERFTPENSVNRPKFAFLPFGGGPRICIGSNFAMMEMLLCVSMISSQFRLKLCVNQNPELDPVITLRPRNGMKMTLERI